MLPFLTENPSALISKKFLLKQTQDVDVTWTPGEVLRQSGARRRNILFDVSIEGEEAVSTIAILYEIRKGHLVLIESE